jgi:hypothetical protein
MPHITDTATLEELSSEGKQSAILETLCEKLLGFDKNPYTEER